MAKLKNPLASLRASGGLGNALSFARRKAVNLVMKRPVPTDARSEAQVSWRTMFNLCVDLWHTLSAAEKQAWESAARVRHMTGYAWYISQCLRPNPGIYLPLQGGTMTGDIDMAKNRVLKLPAPVDAQEPARKAEVDAVDVGEGHITILPFNYSAIIQGTFIFDAQPVQWGGWPFRTNGPGDGDEIHYKAFMEAGTYTLRLLGIKTYGAAILDVYIDDEEIASFDTYSAASIFNSVFTDTDNVVATRGLKTIKLKIDGRNPSSTNWYIYLSSITFWRTA